MLRWREKSSADDLVVRGSPVSSRVALLLRSAEGKLLFRPIFPFFALSDEELKEGMRSSLGFPFFLSSFLSPFFSSSPFFLLFFSFLFSFFPFLVFLLSQNPLHYSLWHVGRALPA
jgi:hypothetical protein